MSVEIEFCKTVTTPEEICQHSEEVKDWIIKVVKEKWNPIAFSDKSVSVFDQPQQAYKHYVMSKTIFKCSAKYLFDVLNGTPFEEQKIYDTDLLEFERDNRDEEKQFEITRTLYKSPWPVVPREFVNCQNWFEHEGQFYFAQGSVNYPIKWNVYNSKIVRGYKMSGTVIKPIDETQCEVTRVVILDPRGSVPSYLTSIFKKDDANRLLLLRKYVEEKFAKK